MLIINEETIANLTDPVELTDVMEQAMITFAGGECVMPDRAYMEFDSNTLLMMPSSCGDYFSTKLVSLFPDNPQKGDPVLFGTVILNDGANGKPLALLNGAKLTAVRTAAVGSVGIRHTSPQEASTLGMIGAGVQGLHQVLFACKNRPIRKVTVYDSFKKLLNPLVDKLKVQLPGVDITIASNPREVCENSEIIITATNACAPVLPDDPALLEGKSIIAIGSYKPDMIELPDSLYSLIDHYFVDVEMALEESGDLIQPLKKGLVSNEKIQILSEAINGNIKVDPQKTTLYKSVGMALFDLFTASYLFNKAKKNNQGQRVIF